MSTFKIPLGPFRFMSEDFKKPNWEEKSITKKLRDFASENKGKIREGHISMVSLSNPPHLAFNKTTSFIHG